MRWPASGRLSCPRKGLLYGPRDVIFEEKSAIKKTLIDEDFVKAPVYETVRIHPNVTSLITERDRAAYRQKRRLISPGFSISYLNGSEPLMKGCLDVLERSLKAGGYAVINMSQMLGNLTSDVMSATSFGGSFGLVESNDMMKNMVMDCLKRAALDIIIDVNEENPETFTHLHVREEMLLFVIARVDTTSTTATFTLLLLVHNQDKLTKLVEEIDSAFPSKTDSITFAKTQDLPYLNAVINKSMRRMPIVAMGLARWTEKPSIISGYEIPADTIVSPAIGQLMRDPQAYKGVEADKKAFYPFSSGSRNCPGQQFALKELRLILVTLIRRYELSLIPDQSHQMRLHTVP
ncbi:cytochrome P450 [Acephala macrosclerotiorum]|nr:cytochrome P450 [Acephala macrosclerotiorum]